MGTGGTRRIVATALGGLVLGCLAVVIAPSAYASCAEQPLPSPHRFIGTVVAVEDDGSLATVRADGGPVVTVIGGPGSPGSNVSSSVDRRYVVGGRYEFHPFNNENPYRDNACTATRRLHGPPPERVEPSDQFLPAWPPIDEAAGPTGYALFFGPIALMGGVTAWLVRRRWMRRPRPGEL